MSGVRAIAGLGLAAWLSTAAFGAFLEVFAEAPGDPERGRALFANKECSSCHRPRGESGIGPALDEVRRPQGAFALAGRLWNHAPAMFTAVKQERLEWPQISVAEMQDLMAYLQADHARDPAPDLFKGQVALLRKGCLKCHSLRREGSRIAPDLAERRDIYASAAPWAAKMWVHTPRMAAKALEVGVLYPRFVDEEMGHLLGFLRSAAK